jgi:hypothetical protein
MVLGTQALRARLLHGNTLVVSMASVATSHEHGGQAHDDVRRPVNSRLHPRVYAILVGLALWFVLSAWIFAGSGVIDYLLFIVSGFIMIAVALPGILSAIRRSEHSTTDSAHPPSFRRWARSGFETWQGRLSGAEAMLQILLPIAAVAFGLTAIGIALHIAVR